LLSTSPKVNSTGSQAASNRLPPLAGSAATKRFTTGARDVEPPVGPDLLPDIGAWPAPAATMAIRANLMNAR
jgi:hypothetical protein